MYCTCLQQCLPHVLSIVKVVTTSVFFHVIAVLSKAQLLMHDIEELLDACTSRDPYNQKQRTMFTEVGVQILRQTSWNHGNMNMTTMFPFTK